MNGAEHSSSAAQAICILGPRAADSPQALQAAFRAAVKATHPDAPGGDAGRFRIVVDAHEALKSAMAFQRPSAETHACPPTLEISPAQAVCGGPRLVRMPDGRRLQASLPAGLRAGMIIGVAGTVRRIAITRENDASVTGDDLRLIVRARSALLRRGGSLAVETPAGTRMVHLPRHDLAAFIVRVPGAGLPARFGRAQGDLLVHVRAEGCASVAAGAVTDLRYLFGLAA